MSHWVDEFYRRIDAGDPASVELWADRIYVQMGNHPPTYTKLDALTVGAFRRVHEALSGVTHEMEAIWAVSPDEVILRSLVNYHRRDGRTVRLPAITTVRRNAEGLIDDLRLYIDAAPLYAGLSARVINTSVITVNPQSVEPALTRNSIWTALVRDAENPTRFTPEITACKVVEKGTDEWGRQWLVRELVLDQLELQERLLFEPEHRITVMRTRSEQRGAIHIVLSEANGALTLSTQFDLLWDGIMEGSKLAIDLGETMAARYHRGFTSLLSYLLTK